VGSGIIVTLESGVDGPDISVMDFLTLLNELRLAGAEAISINNQRIIHNSYVTYINNRHISVDGIRLIAPFTVRAIGNPVHLESGLSQRNHGFVDLRALEGKIVTIERSDYVTIYAFNGDLEFHHARELD